MWPGRLATFLRGNRDFHRRPLQKGTHSIQSLWSCQVHLDAAWDPEVKFVVVLLAWNTNLSRKFSSWRIFKHAADPLTSTHWIRWLPRSSMYASLEPLIEFSQNDQFWKQTGVPDNMGFAHFFQANIGSQHLAVSCVISLVSSTIVVYPE